jgi:hypothetical protein
MTNKIFSLALAATFTLTACGGSGGEDKNSSNTQAPADSGIVMPTLPSPPKIANSGSVDAAFVPGATPRFYLAGIFTQASGDAMPYKQTSDGAVTTLGKYTLSGTSIATQEISGNANYAQGRWNVGTVEGNGTSDQMKGDDYKTYHYVLFNGLAAMPADGSMTCDAGKFTKPSYVEGGTKPSVSGYFGTSTGSAAITFNATGAHVNVAVSTAVGAVGGNANYSVTITGPRSNSFTSGGSAGNSAWVTLGDAGNGSVHLIVEYTVGLANQNTYRGVVTFTCK